jgi:carbonic anhydrase
MCEVCNEHAHSRRHVLRLAAAAGLAATVSLPGPGMSARAAGWSASLTPDEALQRLMDGNKRYVSEPQTCVADPAQARLKNAQAQAPFASILTCADSRVAPELLFGGLSIGEIFVCRNAGNVTDTSVLGSLEYGVAVLHTPLILVLGHERCGAVSSACDALLKRMPFPGAIEAMLKPIFPAVKEAAKGKGDLIDNAVRANAALQAKRLHQESQIIESAVRHKEVLIAAAHYDLDDGTVHLLPS